MIARFRRSIPILLSLAAFSCAEKAEPAPRAEGPPSARVAVIDRTSEFAARFAPWSGALRVRELGSSADVVVSPEACTEPWSPCSTFKLPHALVALEEGLITEAESTLPWDGVKRWNEDWNRDQDLASAIRVSALWYFQELARRLGIEREKLWLDRLEYGNRDASSGLETFWLFPGSLKISLNAQLDFVERMERGLLPVSSKNLAFVKKAARRRQAPGLEYWGKTGSGVAEGQEDIGWWIGSVTRGSRRHVFAGFARGKGALGPRVREVVESILVDLSILPKT